jgi:hypothetical protein
MVYNIRNISSIEIKPEAAESRDSRFLWGRTKHDNSNSSSRVTFSFIYDSICHPLAYSHTLIYEDESAHRLTNNTRFGSLCGSLVGRFLVNLLNYVTGTHSESSCFRMNLKRTDIMNE